MSKPCLLKLDNTWVHYSRDTKRAVARYFNGKTTEYKMPGEDPRLPGGPFEGALRATMAEADAELAGALPFRLTGLRHTETEKWRLALEALTKLDWTPGGPLRGRVVPQTALRKYYKQLRKMSPTKQKAEANDPDTPAHIRQLFEESARQIAPYENDHDAFCPERVWWEAKWVDSLSAHELQARLDPSKAQPGNIVWPTDHPELAFTTVDYEVAPLRTTKHAVLDDGRTGQKSGHGGMDLLLQCNDGTPVVAEIKGKKDTNLFLALVQALTYAVELTTTPQFNRLKKSYRSKRAFQELESALPKSDVSLIYLGAVGTNESPLEKEAMRIARELMRDNDSAVARAVRRIAFLRVQLDGESKLRFSCEELVPSP